ncbi:hypothetical protein AAAC51_04170 [Priestia megaterium]
MDEFNTVKAATSSINSVRIFNRLRRKHSNTMFPSVEISQLSSTKELAAYEEAR